MPDSIFNFLVSVKFVTASYGIFSLSMVQAMEIFMITKHDVTTNPRETNILKQGNVDGFSNLDNISATVIYFS